MINRRDFLISSAAALAGAATRAWAAPGRRPLGAQLYTVRDQAKRHLASALASIRQIGYDEVETYAGLYSHPAAELKQMIADHGLRVPSGHFDYVGLDQKLDYARTLDLEFVICPMLPKTMRTSLDGFKKAADQLNKYGEQVKDAGMRFGFHNHNYEFRRFGDTTGFDILMSATDPRLVCLEMDCYWITQAGQDPMAIFQRLGSRIKMLHLKDRKAGYGTSQDLNRKAEHMTPVGTGTINWKDILAAAASNGVQHMFVEQDSGDLPPLEELRISYRNLQPLLL